MLVMLYCLLVENIMNFYEQWPSVLNDLVLFDSVLSALMLAYYYYLYYSLSNDSAENLQLILLLSTVAVGLEVVGLFVLYALVL